MVNTSKAVPPTAPVTPLPVAARIVRAYLMLVLATLAVLGVLSFADAGQATSHAWGHAVVVAVFAVVLPLRLRAAQAGRRSAIRAVGLIAGVLFVVNVVEALIPGFVPTWMRMEMVVIAALMLVVVSDVVRWAVSERDR